VKTQPEPQLTPGPFDLVLTRVIDVPRRLVWKAWTEPEHLKKWWSPAPVRTTECEMDLRPGGVFRTLMVGPDGTKYPTSGIFLEVVEQERIAFTDALEAGFRPAQNPFFSAIITLEEHEGGTRYTARALHKNQEDRDKHEEMGFHQGWGKALEQLVAVAQQLE
jgi:uncharacterized protein YndB with AHSA1/START domain